MQKLCSSFIILLMAVCLLMSCAGAPSSQQKREQGGAKGVIQLKPSISVPATCPISPVYFGQSTENSGVSGVPWIEMEPNTAKIKGYLFFAGSHPQRYQLLHTGGAYPNGGSTKILWVIEAPQQPNAIEVTGKKLLPTSETFQQNFPSASSPAGVYPSIVNVPTAGCWQLQVKSGTVTASATFWVVGDE